MAAEKKPADKKTTKKAADKKATSSSKKSPYGEGSLQVMGQPRKWSTEQALQSDFIRYIEHCETREDMPNIAGFCTFTDCVRDTFYETRNYYPDTYQKIRQGLEDRAINEKKKVAMSIFYLKNAFNYSDTGKGGDSSIIDVDFDATQGEIDTYLSKLGYVALPDPTE